MNAKKPSASTTRKKACRSPRQKNERSPRCPVSAPALDNSMKKKSNFECSKASASFRDTKSSPSYKISCQLEAKCLKHKARNKVEDMSRVAYEKDKPDIENRDFESPSSADETVVRYLNDQAAIDALQNSDPFFKAVTLTRSEEEKTEGSRAEYAKMSLSITIPDAELKNPQLAESATSSTSSAHRLAILKHRLHDTKLEKLKKQIRRQRGLQGDLINRRLFWDDFDHPVTIAVAENTVTSKVRKVAVAPPAPAYKGFSPSDVRIHNPGEKVRHEEEFLSLRDSRKLCQDMEHQLEEEDPVPKCMPPEKRKKKKATRTVHKVQNVTELPGHDSKPGSFNIISTSSWRDGKRLAMKILGPAPKVKKQTPPSIDGNCSDRSIQSASYTGKTESDSIPDVAIKSYSRNSKRSCSKMRRENSLRKSDAAVQDTEQRDHHKNKTFLSILDDLQVDPVTHRKQETDEENQNSEVPAKFTRSHSPTKKKTDKLAANKELQATYKKHHYDRKEVRRYIFKQQQERKKKQSEQKKVQKEATLQRNKRLQELYKKQREAIANKAKNASSPKLVPKQPQETYSKVFLDQALLEEPWPPLIQAVQPNTGYHPSEGSNKEGELQGHPPSASSSSDMSLSEPHHSLVRDNCLEPLWIQPDRLSSKFQLPFPHPSSVFSGDLFSQHLSLGHMNVWHKDFDFLFSSRSHSTAIGFLPSASPPVTSTLQPTLNQYKGNLDRIEALKAKAASLSSRIESETKRLVGIGMGYGAEWSSGHNSVQGSQGDGHWAKASSLPVKEANDVFSATLQNMSSTCVSQTIFNNDLPGLENPGLGKTISPHTAAAVSLPCKQASEGIVGNLSKKQKCSPDAESIVVLPDCSVQSISEQWLGDHLLSEEEGNQHSPLKTTKTLKEKEFSVVGKTGDEHTEQFQKEAENYLPISAEMRSALSPWEEITEGSPHSAINNLTKSGQLRGQGSEERWGQGSPAQRPSLPVMSPPASIDSYEDDFISSQDSGMVTDKKTTVEPSICSSIPSLKEEFISRKSPCTPQAKEFTRHSSGTPSSSSSAFSKRRGEKGSFSLWEENRMFTESDHTLLETKTSEPSSEVSSREEVQNPGYDTTSEELSDNSLMSLPDKMKSPRTTSCPPSPVAQKQLEPAAGQPRSSSRSQASLPPGSRPNLALPEMNLGAKRVGTGVVSGSMHFSPAGLRHQILAELHYLSTIEKSLQQLSDKKRAEGIPLVQQGSVSLAQILKLTEIACAQNPDAVTIPANPVPLLLDQKQKPHSTFIKKVKAHSDILRKTESVSSLQNKEEMGDSKDLYPSSFENYSESSRSKVHDESSSSSCRGSLFVPFSKETKEVSHCEKSISSIEEEGLTAVTDSLQSNSVLSIPDDRDAASVATEYPMKFDLMTEDEMGEKSFRSLLPSESHRQISLKKQGHHGYSGQKASSRSLSSVKELSLPFSGGQDSFSRFTMEMVQQYMKEEEMRAVHQSLLLQLRKKALKEKTKAELAWLERQEKHLKDKGEDDKMPPIPKKQHGLILKLQQEKAEIKCLQEANKAAQKARQLILKQQEEIEQICQTTAKLQEKLKSAGENKLEHCSDDTKQSHSSSPLPVDAETRSSSSVSSSETHSLMQKFKNMCNRVDKKFLTQREQELMQRRQYAEELLQWKHRLDAEEAEIRQIERHALAAWDKKLRETKANKMAAGEQNDQKETVSEENSSVLPCPRFSSGSSVPEDLGKLAVESGPSKISVVQGQLGSPDHTMLMEETVYMQEIESSASPGKLAYEFIKKTEAELSQDLAAAPTAKPQIKTPPSVTEKPKIKPPALYRPVMTRSGKSLTDFEHCKGSLEFITKHIDAVSLSEISDSSYTKKFIEAEIQTEEHFQAPSPVFKAPQKAGSESGDSLDNSSPLAQPRFPSHGEEKSSDQQEKVGLLTDNFLWVFVRDTVNQLQQIRKVRNEKIQFNNQELAIVQEQKLAPGNLLSILISSQVDDGEAVSPPDSCPRPESPVLGASGQEELAKMLQELEHSQEFLSVFREDQDWFEEDFGSNTHKLPLKQAEKSAVLPKTEPPTVSPKPCEQPVAAPCTAKEVEILVHEATEELWKCKELGHDLQAAGFPRDLSDSLKDNDIKAISKQIYRQVVFDLTRKTFGEIIAEDPHLSPLVWTKPCRVTATYFHRVKDPSNLEDIKSFIATEVLKLLNWKKEPSNRVSWQKMIKFGQKKCDRVDHVLLQELHEEEAQWMNYDKEEFYVKMQLADGIFEALIRETIDVLNQIKGKQDRLLPL